MMWQTKIVFIFHALSVYFSLGATGVHDSDHWMKENDDRIFASTGNDGKQEYRRPKLSIKFSICFFTFSLVFFTMRRVVQINSSLCFLFQNCLATTSRNRHHTQSRILHWVQNNTYDTHCVSNFTVCVNFSTVCNI